MRYQLALVFIASALAIGTMTGGYAFAEWLIR